MIKGQPRLDFGKVFPYEPGGFEFGKSRSLQGGAWILKAFPLQKGGGLVMIGSTTQKGDIMSLKGYYQRTGLDYVYLREFYTGIRYRVPRDKAYIVKTQTDGVCVLADKKDAILGWEGGLI